MNRGRFRNNRSNQHRNDKKIDSGDEKNPVVRSFMNYAEELNDKHDRYERIVKYSRDCTIESKRLIFLLHTVDLRKPSSKKILSDAFNRLTALCTSSFASIAKELENRDPYQYGRAYSAGLQEFVEAFTYYDYLFNDHIMNWDDLQQKLTYTKQPENVDPETATSTDIIVEDTPNEAPLKIKCFVQPIEFMLGLADLSGEIMRKCINSLGCGDIETCRKACNFVQHLYSGYLSLGSMRHKEMSRKVHAMYQSVLKVEKVCYNIQVRGSEAAIWSSNDAIEKDRDEEDEGFANY
ncbi:translin-associated protein X [Contarinia nasturtii]|uniref:translin-associated protein X n=1 Tax=Contarinia nasturtii TaxID=265458 RepID=UPI0012D39253|nr:translin-associated protein X [Contarinia nasturtii]